VWHSGRGVACKGATVVCRTNSKLLERSLRDNNKNTRKRVQLFVPYVFDFQEILQDPRFLLNFCISGSSCNKACARSPISAEFLYLRVFVGNIEIQQKSGILLYSTVRTFYLKKPGYTEFSRNRGSCCYSGSTVHRCSYSIVSIDTPTLYTVSNYRTVKVDS
jgi:hypothetical protein